MRISQAFKLALKSVLGSKMRSFLTMLGMIIGVGSVITLVGLMSGVKTYLINKFADLGTNMLTVSITSTDTRKTDVDDVYAFTEKYSDLFQGVSPTVTSKFTVKSGSESLSTSVMGIGEDYLDLNSLELLSGRFINYADIVGRCNNCVIGSYVVEEVFSGNVKVGDTIKIDGQVFTIVGIQKEESDSEKNSTDDRIYIPYSVATRLNGSNVISNYTFATKNSSQVETADTLLDNYLYSIMKNEELYNISTMSTLLETINSMTAMIASILGGIAGISLVVAGIGIMNIMLVSVVERTKEIGIRKSLGARKRDIMWQFVIEAAVISTVGGIIGILIGCIATSTLANAFGISASPPVSIMLLSFGISAAIGIGFGYMPANKAANLNPIDALRSE